MPPIGHASCLTFGATPVFAVHKQNFKAFYRDKDKTSLPTATIYY